MFIIIFFINLAHHYFYLMMAIFEFKFIYLFLEPFREKKSWGYPEKKWIIPSPVLSVVCVRKQLGLKYKCVGHFSYLKSTLDPHRLPTLMENYCLMKRHKWDNNSLSHPSLYISLLFSLWKYIIMKNDITIECI